MQIDTAQQQGKVIVGLGKTGLSYARYLHSKNENFTVVDSRKNPPGLQELTRIFPDAKVELGEFKASTFLNATELLVSPGVDLREPVLAKAIEQDVPVTGDINIFAQKITAPIVAITGSNAKSTVVSLLGEMALQAGVDAVVAGNIGKPVLDLLNENSAKLYILEISSFQLETTTMLGAEVACVLNVSADHMDRYDSLLDYHAAKHRVFQACKQAVVNRDDPLSAPLLPASVKQWRYGLEEGDINEFGLIDDQGESYLAFNRQALMPVGEVKLAGQHNLSNALAALAIGHAVGLEMVAMLQTLREFSGLPHRCQWVSEIAGVSYYNDSKGTNVGACNAALIGLGKINNVILIAGGQGKGAEFHDLKAALKAHGKLLIVFGEDADLIVSTLHKVINTEKVVSLEEAVKLASEQAEAGDIVLLSPACASFDMFDNYEKRGEAFIEAVEALH
ncbi:MAG: UDP-N-acetylmuramoyl-L-alanine--D-glutamate ligase [SAR86 cluster bacterium]|uniref:UDP-N-acetylmuramoylalanine--D-glutamate ligase n=1 Tax=SAR86 cluster bacterium TaxID=2030880 RepID=A0A2A5C9U4_9GAMM|nr:MAG: UDP-N-acetylmuramoyl-L-alanine--D-glutamate ligase [SAR86 cluster bacterium]